MISAPFRCCGPHRPRSWARSCGGPRRRARGWTRSAALRYGFGTLRDYVIGISFTDDEGHEVKAGGRVVKNVAGYDLCKLHIGALGTLGIITQVTLKLRPQPEESRLVKVRCRADELPQLL